MAVNGHGRLFNIVPRINASTATVVLFQFDVRFWLGL